MLLLLKLTAAVIASFELSLAKIGGVCAFFVAVTVMKVSQWFIKCVIIAVKINAH